MRPTRTVDSQPVHHYKFGSQAIMYF